MLKKILNTFKAEGIEGLKYRLEIRFLRMFPKIAAIFRKAIPRRSKIFAKHQKKFVNLKGIEFGGKSNSFSKYGLCPVYPLVSNLDNCNFGNTTLWEGNIHQGDTFLFDKNKPLGKQYIAEASELKVIPSGAYDFVLSCHMLEHSANPIKTLIEWFRLLKDEGLLLLILPHKDATFDFRRPVTTLAHMIEDYKVDVSEDDLTHLQEVLDLHDLAGDGFFTNEYPTNYDELIHRAKNNYSNRIMHHHVFDTKAALELVDYIGFTIIDVEPIRVNNIIILAKKNGFNIRQNNGKFLKRDAEYKKNSPFKSDRL